MNTCPCFSGKLYAECCQPFHERIAFPATALELMRSRYAAYALALADYLIETTHPDNSHRKENRVQWKEEILTHCRSTQFQGLEIVEFKEIDDLFATVTFIAHLQKQGKNISFMEKSLFRKEEGKWLYLQAQQLRPWPY